MQASDLVELAALISAEAPSLLRRAARFSLSGADAYWTSSKCRLDRWLRQLKLGCSPRNARPADGQMVRPASFATCLEVFTSEVLTRVWAAAAAAEDQRTDRGEFAPIAHSVLFGHQEVRLRVLNVMTAELEGPASRRQRQAQRLDRVRRASERWTDLLLAPLADLCDLEAIAHDPARVRDFAADRIDERDAPTAKRARTILNLSLRSTFRRFSAWPSRNADLNSQIAAAILTCLNFDSLDPAGGLLEGPTYSWLLHARLSSATSDAERLVEDLLFPDRSVPNVSSR
jgi:hypothetical protein